MLAVSSNRGRRHRVSGIEPDTAMEPFYFSPASKLSTVADRLNALEQLQSAMGGESLCSLAAPRFLGLFTKGDISEQLKVWCLRLFCQ